MTPATGMRALTKIPAVMACCLTVSACDGPPHFMAGGELSGAVSDVPVVWQLDEESGLAQLETRPEDPYSINLTYVQMDGRFYIYAGDTKTNWVKHIEQTPLVRIRVDDAIYPTRAVRVDDDDEIRAFAGIWANLSAFQRDPLKLEEIWLYYLVAR